ncbi:ATP-binding protein, partial [Streptomyces sp. Tu 4128]|uniref:ATP-binding protein n=1 Tax=Streptomyces sp. Tu 4128 TaxID=1120314 RepID=UPI0019D24605
MRRLARASLTHWGRSDLVDTAELLLTELVTNALRHAIGAEIGVRLYLQGAQLVIEVNDGSPLVPVPRTAGPEDESARGLLLVEALAAAWGVSADRTTTWCTLPLTEGLSDMEQQQKPEMPPTLASARRGAWVLPPASGQRGEWFRRTVDADVLQAAYRLRSRTGAS